LQAANGILNQCAQERHFFGESWANANLWRHGSATQAEPWLRKQKNTVRPPRKTRSAPRHLQGEIAAQFAATSFR
jgi:hypothetical protein